MRSARLSAHYGGTLDGPMRNCNVARRQGCCTSAVRSQQALCSTVRGAHGLGRDTRTPLGRMIRYLACLTTTGSTRTLSIAPIFVSTTHENTRNPELVPIATGRQF
ncbi:hypothetical protein TRVL_09681 [Trypanosoma vivax]|uniref:Uncharacterized protein n=1 Tax=Trypanosoma vivax (strain Y486) TaxID=1055687 RepID=G0U1F5_TRYVY|nr:hypothetical protein TRVL_09681 [Trypanosoma vivax]CCC49911.1 hypothetical protein, unlikely [Trypanosoma vivax Y486]